MATQYLNIKGKIKWAKLYEENKDSYAGAENWKLNLYPSDEAEWEKFRKTGLELKIRNDEDGDHITLRRPTKKLIKDDLVIFSPPEITGKVEVSYVNEDGDKVRQYNKGDGVKVTRKGTNEMITNGSLAIVNFSYYDTQKGKGHRLESVRILELEVYEGALQADEDPRPKKEELKVETEKKSEKVVDKAPAGKEELNDDIPW